MSRFEEIKKDIRNLNSDSLFDPTLLEDLEFEERKQIEYEIMLNIIQGNSKYYKYIPYLKCFDAGENYLKYSGVYRLSRNSAIKIYIESCKKNNDFNRILELARLYSDNDEVRKELITMIHSNFFGETEKELVKRLIDKKR